MKVKDLTPVLVAPTKFYENGTENEIKTPDANAEVVDIYADNDCNVCIDIKEA